MLPKRVLPSHGRRQGRHDKPLPVDALCNMWIDNDLGSLWNLAKGRAISLIHQSTSSIRQRTNNIDMAISLGRSGMFGKACRILQSSGIAPNNENTWQLLKAKHPSCPAPVVPVVQSTETITLQPDFNILSVLQSFPKDTAAGPSGLRVQHLLDVANIPLPTPICSSLRAACHHDSPHCRVQRVTHPQDEPVTGSGRYRHSSMSPRQSTLQGEESDPPPRAACHRDSPHCRVKRVTHPQDEPVGVTATAACHHDSPYCRVQRVTHPQDEPVTGSGRYRHSSISPRQSTLQGEESDPSPR
ncbi:hypothetical protein EMCRGX_G024895 [Ephydatia muelleri]